jgi:hypothetical protein
MTNHKKGQIAAADLNIAGEHWIRWREGCA